MVVDVERAHLIWHFGAAFEETSGATLRILQRLLRNRTRQLEEILLRFPTKRASRRHQKRAGRGLLVPEF